MLSSKGIVDEGIGFVTNMPIRGDSDDEKLIAGSGLGTKHEFEGLHDDEWAFVFFSDRVMSNGGSRHMFVRCGR